MKVMENPFIKPWLIAIIVPIKNQTFTSSTLSLVITMGMAIIALKVITAVLNQELAIEEFAIRFSISFRYGT